MKKIYFVVMAALALAACTAEPKLEGNWVQPIPGMENQTQGFTLQADGSAQSINMATLRYETWNASGNELTLSGQSIGNGQTIAFMETYTFSFPDPNTLSLKNERGGEQLFTRQK